MTEAPRQTLRLDKWLWQARFFKTRTLATKLVAGAHVRVNGTKTDKPAAQIGPGDTLTFPQGHEIRVVRILALGDRRGPATEARTLYEDLTPIKETPPASPKYEGGGRPTKKQRRDLDRTRKPPLE
ncbi:RNA-binding S4 domain-containing protein [Rhodovulum visakhapatnamense]|uniref:Heat shock protein Hsp15 n=1 Tax=Rhodovulum visakhapatnamense TaxID=364297 RepID=A0A4R8FYU6_9RHOB|nr:RNA-binding S4 domain-containing protein [Rhodovulum visakhapatnamense]TDX31854.1 heat shock protein Hsp15 [Rhodovulum visakhapatnamense]